VHKLSFAAAEIGDVLDMHTINIRKTDPNFSGTIQRKLRNLSFDYLKMQLQQKIKHTPHNTRISNNS